VTTRRRLRNRAGLALALLVGIACLAQAGWIHVKAVLAQALVAHAFERALDGDEDARPWPWADTRPVARLRLPGADGTLIVLAGASGRNLAFGPAHDPASAAPGEPGNSVIAAHRDTHFRVLEGLRIGDPLGVERVDGRNFEFVVTAIEIVDSRRARIALDHDTSRLTLVTCHPFDALLPSGPMRFVVTADPVGRF
jgi:sortase A